MAENAGYFLSPQQRFILSSAADARAQIAVQISGSVDLARLRNALDRVVQTHESLRTTFQRKTGMKMPFQIVLEDCPATWSERTSLPLAEQAGVTAAAWMAREAAEPMPPDASQLRSTIYSTAEDGALWILTAHAAVADAAAMQLIVENVTGCYADSAATFEEPLRYVQFAEWQNGLLTSDDDDAVHGRAVWAKLREDAAEPAIGGGTREAGENSTASYALDFSANPSDLGPSADNVLLAAWSAFLSRWCAAPQVLLGVAFAGRDYEELAPVVGAIAKACPFVAPLKDRITFRELAAEVASLREQLAAVQEYCDAERSFRVGYEHVALPAEMTADAIQFTVKAVRSSAGDCDLKLLATAGGQRLKLELQYRASVVDAVSVEQIAQSFEAFLADGLANPDQPVASLSLVSSLQGVGLLSLGSGAVLGYPLVTVHGLISAQALRTPLALAVGGGGASLTYQELEARSNRLARYLGTLGVGPGSRVGLAVSRSPAMMVPLLAILKAGAAYVALAADQPKARIAQQLVGVKAVVTEAALQAQLPEMDGAVLVMDGEAQPWTEQPDHVLQETATPEDLAYVLYTSGSTGTPKGVAVRHRNLVNYATHIVRSLGLDTTPLAFATVSTLAADLGNTVLFPALLTGGTLHVLPYDIATDGRRMAEYCRAQPIDVLKIVPSHLAALLDGAGDEAGDLLPKRYLITGGEALKPALVERVLSHGSCQVINHYGPTETTVGSMMLPLEGFDWKQAQAATIPIGRPIANTRAYVLDASRNLVPIGVTGELYLAGAGVARGYLDQPERTAERFVPDPFAAGETMYRSGDLARWLPSGVVEFLGRADDQVKIRGFRVELGEIEAALLALAGVRQAVVLMRPKHDDQQLVAYVVLDRQQPGSAEALREALKLSLPDYMVPAAIVPLPRLPLTANGKLDRAALPEPEERATRKYIAPTTPTEQLVQQIWQDVLKLQQISTDENFFDLGGHSLLATQVVSRLRESMRIEIPLRTMFDAPVLATFAAGIDSARASGAAVMANAPIQRAARRQYSPGASGS